MESFELSLQNMRSRIFWIWYCLMLGNNFAGSLMAFILQGPGILAYFCSILEVLMILIFLLVIKTKRKVLASTIMLFLVTGCEFPLLYLVYREIIVAYFIISIIAIIVFAPGKSKWIMLPFVFVINIAVILLAQKINLPNNVQNQYVNIMFSLFTFFATAFAAVIIAYSMIHYYEKRKKQLSDVNERLRYAASHDSLTTLYNRGYIMEALSGRMAANDLFYAAILDIDDFKKINDTYGHTTGDAVLRSLGQAIINQTGEAAICGRYGGEEFLILFDDSKNEAAARLILNLISEKFQQLVHEKYDFPVNFSGGLGCSINFTSVDDFIQNIDKKLYKAKFNGKNMII